LTLPNQNYRNNPLIHKDRRPRAGDSPWRQGFSCADMRPLIVCRGPIRKETMDIFEEMGIEGYGILLSEKDSIVYTYSLAPELRQLTDPRRVHRVPDYIGVGKTERAERIRQIIQIARENHYDAIFAGYGFMAEDVDFVAAIEAAGLMFIGPCAHTVRRAGRKDEAKRTALEVDVSVTPGIDDLTTRTLLHKYPDAQALAAIAVEKVLAADAPAGASLTQLAEALLEAGYLKGVDLFTMDELAAQVCTEAAGMWRQFPNYRIRLKAIGGGGGKGQRILAAPAEGASESLEERIAAAAAPARDLVLEILNEVKATGTGDNKNILLELNIESTRHQEVQLLGNGEWCIALGARDCSLQMHEQKLLEISVTQESLTAAIAAAGTAGDGDGGEALARDLVILKKMEAEAERFGLAVGLDSASTFECILDRDRHFFMEVNTRIQVEHRVTELCYALEFTNPDDPADHFVVDSLVEAMVLLARHKHTLPMPRRLPRFGAAVESRLNAVNAALAPHAGGLIGFWSDPIEGEIRDDQGISLKNPDTGTFMKYRISGAYDANIALLVTHGRDRQSAYERLSEILRRTKLEGSDLATNLAFHYGLVNWFIGQNVNAKPTTRFVVPYLTMVGRLRREAELLDCAYAFEQIKKSWREYRYPGGSTGCQGRETIEEIVDRKQTLVQRPVARLLSDTHLLAGWLSRHRHLFDWCEGTLRWLATPVDILADRHHFLNMDYRRQAPPAEVIWHEDHQLLQKALSFYTELKNRLGELEFSELDRQLQREEPPYAELAESWPAIRGAHLGFQAGLELLGLLPAIAAAVSFFELQVLPDLSIVIPEPLLEPAHQKAMAKVLAPPPATSADRIVAVCGGMFYAREAPGRPAYVHAGDHFEAGDPLYIIEVMKMFNKVHAPFSGTVVEVLIDNDGSIVTKGQPLFRVVPDEKMVFEEPREVQRRRRQHTNEILVKFMPESLVP